MEKSVAVGFTTKLPATHHIIMPFLFFVLLCVSGCASLGFITYYDPTTYKNLTDTKSEVLALYGTFSRNSVNQDKIEAIRLKLSQIVHASSL